VGWDREELFSVPVGKDGANKAQDNKNGRRNGNNGSNGGANGTAKDRPWSWQRFALRPGRGRRRHLITGGAGFIGSHLAEELLKRKEEVYVIDNLSTGSIENIDHLRDNPNFHYVIDTIANEGVLAEFIDRCDTIFHMAAAVGVKLVVEEPVRTIETNIFGTEAVLRHAAKKGKRVVLASTSEVYGKSARVPFREDEVMVFGPSTKRRWAYACSKAMDEFLALAYLHEYDLPVTVLRFFNTVGPRQVGTYGMVVPRFVRAALRGDPLRIHGDGNQTRCFSYVGDIVNAAIKVAFSSHTVGEVYNVGSDEEISIAELAERVVAVSNSNSPIVHVPYEEAYGEGFEDMRRRVPDLSKIRQAIGYKSTHDLGMILSEVVAHESSRVTVEPQPAVQPPVPV
jgi:UDP-glucose 4-epimerase